MGTDIQSAINAAPEGTIFCLQAGVYRLTQGIVPKSNDTLVGAPGTILNGAKLLTSFTRENRYFVASGQTQHNPVVIGECSPVTYIGCQYADAVFFDDRPLWRVMSLGEVVAGTFYFDYPNGKIYLAGETGETLVLRGGRTPDVLARNKLEMRVIASPAISGGRIFVRGDRQLVAIQSAAR